MLWFGCFHLNRNWWTRSGMDYCFFKKTALFIMGFSEYFALPCLHRNIVKVNNRKEHNFNLCGFIMRSRITECSRFWQIFSPTSKDRSLGKNQSDYIIWGFVNRTWRKMKMGSYSQCKWCIQFGNKWPKDWRTIEIYACLTFGQSIQDYE